MTVDIETLFDIQIDESTAIGQDRYDHISSILYQVGLTPEGQSLFQDIQNRYGTITITESFRPYSELSSFGNDPNATIANINDGTINVNWDQIGRALIDFEGFHPADRMSLNRAVIHEIFHLVDSASILEHYNNSSVMSYNFEKRAMNFENEFMAKYYGEEFRAKYEPVSISNFVETTFYGSTDPNAISSYVYRGNQGTSMMDLIFDPNDPPENFLQELADNMLELINGLKSALTWGDPHLVTFDGLNYDFQAPGEFVLVESTDASRPFEIQVRHELVPNSNSISLTKAMAMDIDGHKVGIYADPNNTPSSNSDFIAMHNAGTLDALGGNDTVFGSSQNDVLIGGLGNDILIGNNGNDVIVGGAGDDIMVSGTGNDTAYGGTGVDQLRFSGSFDQYSLTQNATTGVRTVTHNAGIDGTDLVANDVEQLIFTDGIYASGVGNYTICNKLLTNKIANDNNHMVQLKMVA